MREKAKRTKKTRPLTRRDVELIVNDLFINGGGQRADRLVLTDDGPPTRDLGGWSRAAIADRIFTLLRKQLKA